MYTVSNVEYSILADKSEAALKQSIKNFLKTHRRGIEPVRDLIICYLVIIFAWFAAIKYPYWWVYCLTCVVITSVFVGFIGLIHEAYHDNLSSRKANDFIAWWLLSLPMFTLDYERDKNDHISHHRFLGKKEDPTLFIYEFNKYELWKYLVLRTFFIDSIISLFKKKQKSSIPDLLKNKSLEIPFWPFKSRWTWKMFFCVFHGSLFVIFMFKAPLLYFFNWLIPANLATVLSTIRTYVEHKSKDRNYTASIATTYANIAELLFISQFNFHHHSAHHLLPSVPYKHLPELTKLLDRYGWPKTNIPVYNHSGYLSNIIFRSHG